VGALVDGLRAGDPARGFLDAVAQCGARLAEAFPRAPGGLPPRNELEDAIRTSER
jgi:putative membrane protein